MGFKEDMRRVQEHKEYVSFLQNIIGLAMTGAGLWYVWNSGRNKGCAEIAHGFAEGRVTVKEESEE